MEAEELLSGTIKLKSRHLESNDEVINNVANYLKLLDLTGRSVLKPRSNNHATANAANRPGTTEGEDVYDVCENILSKVQIRRNVNNPHRTPVNLNFGYLSNFLKIQQSDIITAVVDLVLKHNPLTHLAKVFDTFNYYLFDKLLSGVVAKWSDQFDTAKCLIADGKWTILMSKLEANYRTHMEISIILLVKMIEAFVTIESALNASRGLDDDRTAKNHKFRLLVAQMNSLYQGDFEVSLEELDMVHDSLQISLIRTPRDAKEEANEAAADSDEYYAPLMNSTRIEDSSNSKRLSNYYDIPKLPSVSPIADLPHHKEAASHRRTTEQPVVIKEYEPLDKSFRLNALDDIDYYNTPSDDDDEDEEAENILMKKSFTEFETIVDLSKKYKTPTTTGATGAHHKMAISRSSNDYVAIWNCASSAGAGADDGHDCKTLLCKLECIETSQSVTINHVADESSVMKVESPPPPTSGMVLRSRALALAEHDIDELGNVSNNANKKYLKNRYGLRSKNGKDDDDSDDSDQGSEKKYSLTRKDMKFQLNDNNNNNNAGNSKQSKDDVQPPSRRHVVEESSQVVPNVSTRSMTRSANLTNSERIDQARKLLFTKLNTNLNTLIKNTAAKIKFMKAYNTLIKESNTIALDETINRLFNFFNQELFFSLLRDVQLEWSYRLKSTAATTVVVTDTKPSFILIRFSYNLMSKLNVQEVVKMLLHEMIHGFLGLAVGNLDEKHGKTYRSILKKINEIFNIEIPIEHNYEEVFDLAHVWICNKCNEKRIRFYNVPPTEHQLEDHATKCNGKFLKTKNPD